LLFTADQSGGQYANGSVSSVQDQEIATRSTEGGSGSTTVNSLMNATINPLGTGHTAAVFAGANINNITNCSFNIFPGNVNLVQNGNNNQAIETGDQDD